MGEVSSPPNRHPKTKQLENVPFEAERQASKTPLIYIK
jgi:hypothetical protein